MTEFLSEIMAHDDANIRTSDVNGNPNEKLEADEKRRKNQTLRDLR